MAKSSRREEGQSLVEFAVSLPLLLFVVTGILIFGIVLYQSISVNQAAQAGLRRVAVSRGLTTDPCAVLAASLANSLGTLSQSKLTVSLVLNGTTYNGLSCPAGNANMLLGAPIQLNLSYPARLVLVGDTISSSFLLKAQEQDKIQ